MSTKGKIVVGRDLIQNVPDPPQKYGTTQTPVGRATHYDRAGGGRPESGGKFGRAIEHDPTKR